MDLTGLTAVALRDALESGRASALDVANDYLARIARLDGSIHAYLRVDPDSVRDQARAVDAKRASGQPLGVLAGIPVAIKDNICTLNEPTTCASRMLAGYRPPFDATVIQRLRAADAVLIGKTNLDEFAMGSSTENSAFGVTRNPWDLERIPGGSSGGSAAAVAASMAPLALGSDTGGSIRQPAALCGITGLKPTYGRVSRYGLVAFASSLDQIGPMTHNVADSALLLQAIAGHDPHDSTSVEQPVPDYLATLETAPEGLRVGVVSEFLGDSLDAEVGAAVEAAAAVFRDAGAIVKSVSLPHSKYGIPAYYLVATAEASSNLARYDGTIFGHRAENYDPTTPEEAELPALIRMMMASRAEGFGPEVKRRIMLGTFALSAGYADQYYNQALKVRRLIRNDFDAAFRDFDILIGPTTPTPAFKIGEKSSDPLTMYLSDIDTITVNLAGVPCMSVPCGITRAGLPLGLQIFGAPFAEDTMFRAARVFEKATDWHTRRPELG